MAMSDWLVLVGVCLLYVVAGRWAKKVLKPFNRDKLVLCKSL